MLAQQIVHKGVRHQQWSLRTEFDSERHKLLEDARPLQVPRWSAEGNMSLLLVLVVAAVAASASAAENSCGGVLLPAPGVMSVAHVEDIYSAGFPPLGVVTKAHSEDIYSAGFPVIGVVEATACDTTATSSEGGLETSPVRAPLTALARTFCPSALRLPLLCATLCNSTPHHARRR